MLVAEIWVQDGGDVGGNNSGLIGIGILIGKVQELGAGILGLGG